MIRIPTPGKLANTQVQGPGLAGADKPAAALGQFAQQVAATSQEFNAIATDLQRTENAYAISTARSDWSRQKAQLDADLTTESDPSAIITRTSAFLDSLHSSLEGEDNDYPPEVRERLALDFTDFRDRASIAATANAAQLAKTRASLAMENDLNTAVTSRDPEFITRSLDNYEAAGIILPEKRQALEAELNGKIAALNQNDELMSDPAHYLAKYSDTPPPGIEPWQHEQNLRQANGILKRQAADAFDQFQDIIAEGQPISAQDIDTIWPDLRPAARAAMKDQLTTLGDRALQQSIRTPEFQQQNLGEITLALKQYQAQPPNTIDADYIKLAQRINQITDPAIKAEFTKNLKGLREDSDQQITDTASYARSVLDTHLEEGGFGPTKNTFTLGHYLDRGLISDQNTLTGHLGFSIEQADKLMNDDLSESERIALFRQMWPHRKDQERYKNSRFSEAAQALYRGQDRGYKIDQLDDSTRHQTLQKYGATKTQLETYLRANPRATHEDIEKNFKIFRNMPAYQKATGTIVPSAPPSLVLPPIPADPTAPPKKKENPNTASGALLPPLQESDVMQDAEDILNQNPL